MALFLYSGTLVLANERQAAKALGDHSRLIMVAVAGQVDDLDPRVGNGLADQLFDLFGGHGHQGLPSGLEVAVIRPTAKPRAVLCRPAASLRRSR